MLYPLAREPFLRFHGPRLPDLGMKKLDVAAAQRCPRLAPYDIQDLRRKGHASAFQCLWDQPSEAELIYRDDLREWYAIPYAAMGFEEYMAAKPQLDITSYRPTHEEVRAAAYRKKEAADQELGRDLLELRYLRDHPTFAIWKGWVKKARLHYRQAVRAAIEEQGLPEHLTFDIGMAAAEKVICRQWFQHHMQTIEDEIHSLAEFRWPDQFEAFVCDNALSNVDWTYLGEDLQLRRAQMIEARDKAFDQAQKAKDDFEASKAVAAYWSEWEERAKAIETQIQKQRHWIPVVIDKTKPVAPGNLRWEAPTDPCDCPPILFEVKGRQKKCFSRHRRSIRDRLHHFLHHTGLEGLHLLAWLKTTDCRGPKDGKKDAYPGFKGTAGDLATQAGTTVDTVLWFLWSRVPQAGGRSPLGTPHPERKNPGATDTPTQAKEHIDFVLPWAASRWDEVIPAWVLEETLQATDARALGQMLMRRLAEVQDGATAPWEADGVSPWWRAMTWIEATRPYWAADPDQNANDERQFEDTLREILLHFPPTLELQLCIELLLPLARCVKTYQSACDNAYRLRLKNRTRFSSKKAGTQRRTFEQALAVHERAEKEEAFAFRIRDYVEALLPWLTEDPEEALARAVELRYILHSPEEQRDQHFFDYADLRNQPPEVWWDALEPKAPPNDDEAA